MKALTGDLHALLDERRLGRSLTVVGVRSGHACIAHVPQPNDVPQFASIVDRFQVRDDAQEDRVEDTTFFGPGLSGGRFSLLASGGRVSFPVDVAEGNLGSDLELRRCVAESASVAEILAEV